MVKQVMAAMELDKIKNGQFIQRLNGQLEKASSELVSFVLAHPAYAKGAKSKLTIEITIACDGGEPTQELYSIKGSSKLKVPDEPAVTSRVDVDTSDAGELELRLPFTEGSVEQQQTFLPLKAEVA